MTRYQVVDVSGDGALMSVRDGAGKLHVAHLLGAQVMREDILLGRQAKLGSHLLLAPGRDRPLMISFLALACTQDGALTLMHPPDGEPKAAPPVDPATGPIASEPVSPGFDIWIPVRPRLPIGRGR